MNIVRVTVAAGELFYQRVNLEVINFKHVWLFLEITKGGLEKEVCGILVVFPLKPYLKFDWNKTDKGLQRYFESTYWETCFRLDKGNV